MSTSTLTPQQIYRKKAAGEPIHPDEEQVTHRHVIMLRLNNHIGALNRVANLFSARGFNLDSVTVGSTDDPEVSRLTIVTSGTRRKIDQALLHLANLIDVLEVDDLTGDDFVERELCLLKVRYTRETRAEIKDFADVFRARVVDINPDTFTFEVTGPTKKINAFVGLMQTYGIDEIARSGRVALRRDVAYDPDE